MPLSCCTQMGPLGILADDADGLADFLHTHLETGVAVTLRGHGDIELIVFVAEVGVGFAQVAVHAAGAQVVACHAAAQSHLTGDDTHTHQTVDEHLVVEEKLFHLIHGLERVVAEIKNLFLDALGQVARHAADAGVAGGEAGAANLFVEVMHALLFFESVEEGGHGACVHGVHTRAEEAGGNARQLAAEHADSLTALGQLPTEQLLHRAGVGDVVAHGGEVVHAVRVGHKLVVVAVLRDFFHAAVQVADDGVTGHNLLTVNDNLEAQHAVCRGVGGTHIQGHELAVVICVVGQIIRCSCCSIRHL